MYVWTALVRSPVPRRIGFDFGTDYVGRVIRNAKSIRVHLEDTHLLIRKL
jgi:hypothetical protein